MIHAAAIAESIVAPMLFRPAFLHSLDPEPTWGLAMTAGRRIDGLGQFPRDRLGLANAMLPNDWRSS